MSSTALPKRDGIRGITIRQPWAACIVHGGKRIENRPRPWAPGWYLLHAAARIDQAALRDPLAAHTIAGQALPTRAVVGIVRITGSHRCDGACSPWAQPAAVHHVLDGVHPLPEPVPCTGQLGPWRVPPTVYARVLAQLPHPETFSTEALS
ncbi:hypothetical protein OHB41_50835 [Streptomyces sp. NBC_01571]|uniref:hypothetical protein n=1 Tax=Streptomyces sp. NBC_01571 TaxID=2975883 RepID=UPI00225B6E46|nr:hypothetical protein [Streptomyces sp. NBC_01571]MCX4581256.1 hypothetical protein [Streptomyces sp. NBC_01571]